MSFTEDDRKWMLAQLEKLATKAELEKLATKAELEKLAGRAELEKLAVSVEKLRDAFENLAGTVETMASKAELERVETSLLTAFHKWASPQEARARTHSAALRAIDLEMEALSERVTKLEPPH